MITRFACVYLITSVFIFMFQSSPLSVFAQSEMEKDLPKSEVSLVKNPTTINVIDPNDPKKIFQNEETPGSDTKIKELEKSVRTKDKIIGILKIKNRMLNQTQNKIQKERYGYEDKLDEKTKSLVQEVSSLRAKITELNAEIIRKKNHSKTDKQRL